MRPLELKFTNHKPAVSQFGRFSNLKRITTYNHLKADDYLTYNYRFFNNKHLLVQVLATLNIDPSWSLEYLYEFVSFQQEGVGALFNFTCIRNKGKVTHNQIYQPEFTEQFVLLPNKEDPYEYLNEDESLSSPIVPLCSNEILIDYEGPVLHGSVMKPNPDKFAIIGVDLIGLAIGYWRYLNNESTLNKSAHYWLVNYPLLNARILAQRVALLDVLYNSVVSNVLPPDFIDEILLTPQQNSVSDVMSDYLAFTYKEWNRTGLYDETHLLATFPSWDTLPVDPLMVNGGSYLMYRQCLWSWQLPAIKLMTIINLVNKRSNRCSDIVKSRVQTWLRQDIAGMVNIDVPKALQPIYKEYVNNLIASVE